MARPRALACRGRSAWLDGRPRAARRAWIRALHEAERLRMPFDVASAHHELGRHLADGERSALGLDGAAHLRQAVTGYRAVGCTADLLGAEALLEKITRAAP